ncbi:hypothetical protein Fcan01_23680 [Folsomia candida]|uniref:Uncharacterized protein n=1 Tax=Folsomia candida TaxID=158441 RepID=A0A226DB29_FOLCA|nr:hypothetical protein Fcan01_23680 [Folsomia candida]
MTIQRSKGFLTGFSFPFVLSILINTTINALNVTEFVNTFTTCHPTFTVDFDATNRHESYLDDVLPELELKLPILLRSPRPDTTLPIYSLPKFVRYVPQVTKGICLVEYVFGLEEYNISEITSKFNDYGKFRTSALSTSYKFVVVVIPSISFPIFAEIFGKFKITPDLKVFLVKDKPGHDDFRANLPYFCSHCPTNSQIMLENATNERHGIVLQNLVDLEKTSLAAFSYPAVLNLLTSKEVTSVRFVTPVASGPHVRDYLQKLHVEQYPSASSHFTRCDVALETFSFRQILDFTLLQDYIYRLENSSPTWKQGFSYQIPQLSRINQYLEKPDIFVVTVDTENYNFLTCASVHKHILYSHIYLSPMDPWCWLLLAACVISMTALIGYHRGKWRFSILLDLSDALLEKPILIRFQPTNMQIFLFSVWVGTSVVITTGWKANFTTQIVRPINTSSPFNSFLDISNFTFYSPIPTSEYALIDDPSLGEPFPELIFAFRNLLNSRIQKISEMARNTLEISPTLGYTRIKPLAYKYPAYFWGNMTRPSCDGRAYADTRQHIDEILPFANKMGADLNNGVRFVKGKDPLRIGITGWMWFTPGDASKAELLVQRQHGIITSGIFNYWKELYFRFKPTKLFQDYDKRFKNTGPAKVHKGARRLGLNSNVASILIIYLFLCQWCLIWFLGEVCKGK